MSGGRFDYKQHVIRDIYEAIEFAIEAQGKLEDIDWQGEEYYYEVFKPEVEQAMKEGVEILKKAYIYAHRIDWFLSGDDSEVSFLQRLDDELKQLKGE